MRTFIILVIIALFFLFSGCAVRKEPVQAPTTGKDFSYYLNQGSLFLAESDPGKAIIPLKEAIALKPDSSKAHNLLGIAYFQKKDHKLAKREYEKAIEINPSYAQAYNNLGSACFMLQEFTRAEEMFKKAISISPELVSAHYSLGSLLVIQGRIEESTFYFSKGIELDPEFLVKNSAFIASFSSDTFKNPEILFLYAKVYASAGDIEKAVFYLKKAEMTGFKDWFRIEKEKEFEKVREDQRIKSFIRS